ncbi:MAG: hypothetical protein GY803_03800 [Chloroflexi bacterium]|nr:hypothetical protein [Chloroflexota bacterium]
MASLQVAGIRVAKKRHSLFFFLYSLFFVIFLTACATEPPIATRTDPATGIAVADEFAAFYAENGGRRTFGDPITAGFEAPDNGRFVQYFQTMRLELDGSAVGIYPLGEWALAGLVDPIPAPTPENSASRLFSETNVVVQDEFLSFYDDFNGEMLLGLPISAQLDEGDLRVQYFENGRLEWRSELPLGQRIQVSYLGQAHFDAEMVFAYRQNQLARPVPYAGIERVDVFTSVAAAVLYTGDEQTLYVTVLTPDGRPVSGISADVTIAYGNHSSTVSLGEADAEGRIVAPLSDLNAPPGQQVQLTTAVYSTNGEIIGSHSLTFKTWW